MTQKNTLVMLPVQFDRETDPSYRNEAIELTSVLQKAIVAWAKDRPEKPKPQAIGAACYAAMWCLSESAGHDIQQAMRNACLSTLLANDVGATMLLLADNSLPPN